MTRRAASSWGGLPLSDLRRRWNRADVHAHGRIDSTNAAARELALKGSPAGTIVVCREQSDGRGRAGRTWHSPRDAGVYLSMVFRPGQPLRPAPASVLSGLGVVRRLDRALPGLRPLIKWPNDVMVPGGKVAGVLAEAAWSERLPAWLVVGVGVNVRPIAKSAPRDVRQRATSLDEALAAEVPLVEVADAVIAGLEDYLYDPPAAIPAALLPELDRYDWLRDRRAVVTLPGETQGTRGTCAGIAPDGALLFRPDRGALRRVQDATVEAVR